MRHAFSALLLICSLSVPSFAQQPVPPAAVPVGTVAAEKKPIEQTMDFVGRIEAMNRVEITARIKGYLEAVLFKEGDFVKEGTPLYRIEPGPFEASVKDAEGALLRAKAQQTLGAVQRSRAEELYAKQTGTAVARDQAVAAEQTAAGQVASAQAALDDAKINLGYTNILSPITGKISRTNVTIGNVVGPDSGPLTVIVSEDPMYVTFPVSQREFLRAQKEGRAVGADNVKIRIRLADGSFYAHDGRMNFVDVTVNKATDTVLLRGTVPNPDADLIDGQLVTVVLPTGSPEERVMVPQAALIADQEGIYVFVVEDGKAVKKLLKVNGSSGTNAIVTEGLSGGEQVVVEGLQAIRPGVAVHATPVLPAVQGG
jgi:membrane fusion protein (multidrug efflux system)